MRRRFINCGGRNGARIVEAELKSLARKKPEELTARRTLYLEYGVQGIPRRSGGGSASCALMRSAETARSVGGWTERQRRFSADVAGTYL